MKMKKELQNDNERQYLRNSLLFYYESKVNYDKHTKSFETIKGEFESDMDLLFDKYANDEDEIRLKTNDMYAGTVGLKVKKVQSVKVTVNPTIFARKCSDADIKSKVLRSTYQVTDIMGLLKFLKDQGIRYSDVKSFIKRAPVVNYDALNNLVDIGELDPDIVKESSEVDVRKPYYKFTPVRQVNPARKPVI